MVDWEERYRSGHTPWDFGGVPSDFSNFLQRQTKPFGHVLVPGCGSAYEVIAFAQAGNCPIGMDLSRTAVARARPKCEAAGASLLVGDFFHYPFEEKSFDAIYERTFLCAINPSERPAYARRVHQLLKPGGLLFGYFLYGSEPDGPPHPLAPGEEKQLLEPWFDCQESRRSRDPLALLAEMEFWQVWQKKYS